MGDTTDGPKSSGIELKVAIVDYGVRDENGEPKYYSLNQRFSEFELARNSSRNLIDDLTRMAISKVVDSWRGNNDR